jgi:hypothetical protein
MRDEISMGRVAEELLNNETLIMALDDIAEDTFIQFLSTDNLDVRDQIWATGQVLGLVKSKLESYRDNAKLALREQH